MLFEGRELEINKWDGDAEELLRGVREKLNALGEVSLSYYIISFPRWGELDVWAHCQMIACLLIFTFQHWSRDEKNRCLRETTKAFRFLGQIVRLIIL